MNLANPNQNFQEREWRGVKGKEGNGRKGEERKGEEMIIE